MSLSRHQKLTGSGVQYTYRLKTIVYLFLAGMFLAACSTSSVQVNDTPLVDDKYSLKADREALDALRKNIPPEKQKENDEKAFMDQMMTDFSKNPSEVRSKFSSIINKKRETFNKDMTKTREQFSGAQKKDATHSPKIKQISARISQRQKIFG